MIETSTQSDDLSRYIVAENGTIRFNIPDGVVPDFLVRAFNGVSGGRLQTVRELLTESNIAWIDEQVSQGRRGALFCSLLLAIVWQRLGDFPRAIDRYQRIRERAPHPLVLNELAELYSTMGRPSEALVLREQALARHPDDAGIAVNVALDRIQLGRLQVGLQQLRTLVDQGRITSSGHSCYLFYAQYDPALQGPAAAEDRRRWAARHGPESLVRYTHTCDRDPERPLRIGFISADFRAHSVAYNFEPFLDGCPRDQLRLVGYGNVACPDQVTQRLAAKFDVYRSVFAQDDSQVADQIKADGIDILVALAGHSAGHRLGVLACKPAPVQVDSGGLATTGLPQVDYRLTDRLLDPPETQPWYVERFVYLDASSICYRPPAHAPAPGSPPVLRHGRVTFGSCNNHLKINDDVIRLWSEVLKVCPEARLVLKCKAGHDERVRADLLKRFERQGIVSQRIAVTGWLPDQHHLQIYHEIDIVLDTFPFNGAVTTLEALYMGVPVITLAGNRFVARTGQAVMHHLRLDSFCAHTPQQFVARAAALAQQVPSLETLRASLRPALSASPLCDARRYAESQARAYRDMWRQWCQSA